MPEVQDEITDNLSQRHRDEKKKVRIRGRDGTLKPIVSERKSIGKENGQVVIDTSIEYSIDDLGNLLKTAEDFGGICRCGNQVHREFFFHCSKCGIPQCTRCARWYQEKPYCAWCSMTMGFVRLFSRR
ncbi:hypothetical protein BVY01_00715 [bacterium I07]|nr:hypothetical protein BVY01_00715 [bacterium I07]